MEEEEKKLDDQRGEKSEKSENYGLRGEKEGEKNPLDVRAGSFFVCFS